MSAAVSAARLPLSLEGQRYWESLVAECQRRIEAINAVASRHGFEAGEFVQCASGDGLHIFKSECPSTSIHLGIEYHPWGPVVSAHVKGREEDDLEFRAEELEIPIARDLDGSVVAVFDQGRSFSPRDLATYLMQNFRRCFPGVSLPC